MTSPTTFKLSICIPTFNRAGLIGATIDSIIAQATNDCEIVISDNASTDGTKQLISEYAQRFDRLHYVRHDTNQGIDRNVDCSVMHARGEYCWVLPDDDLLMPGAVAAVLEALAADPSLVIVNIEAKNFDMSQVVQRRWVQASSDRVYGPHELERLFVDASNVLKYLGCSIIKRAIWISRERKRYYDSWFIWLGVIFQQCLPGNALLIAKPLISYRMGNAHTYSPQYAEIWFSKLPSFVESLTTVSEEAKNLFWAVEPWKNFKTLLRIRARGLYSFTEYRNWIQPRLCSYREKIIPTLVALLPGVFINAILFAYYSITRRYDGVWQPEMTLERLRESRYYFGHWRARARQT